KYLDVAPRMVHDEQGSRWLYEDIVTPTSGLSVTRGKRKEEFSPAPVPFEEMHPSTHAHVARIVAMAGPGMLPSLTFPPFTRFCGQIFWEAKDKELAMLCVQAY